MAWGWQEMGEGDGARGGLDAFSRASLLLLCGAVACRAALLQPEQCLTLLHPAASLPCHGLFPEPGFLPCFPQSQVISGPCSSARLGANTSLCRG